MANTPRRPGNPMDAAEAMFKPAKKAAPPRPQRSSAIPVGKETVSLRVDRDVLEWFQADGPGWQERINAALRAASGLATSGETGRRPEELDASNDD
jgi:uncharacterized protein (DUF4415 family)